MKTEDLEIEGMTCRHCIMSVQKALKGLTGVRVDVVEIGKARVQYDNSRVMRQDLADAIEKAGYRLADR